MSYVGKCQVEERVARLQHLYEADAETEVCVIREDEAAGEQNANR